MTQKDMLQAILDGQKALVSRIETLESGKPSQPKADSKANRTSLRYPVLTSPGEYLVTYKFVNKGDRNPKNGEIMLNIVDAEGIVTGMRFGPTAISKLAHHVQPSK